MNPNNNIVFFIVSLSLILGDSALTMIDKLQISVSDVRDTHLVIDVPVAIQTVHTAMCMMKATLHFFNSQVF